MGRGICIKCARSIDYTNVCPMGYCNHCCADFCHRKKKLPTVDPARQALNALGYGVPLKALKRWVAEQKRLNK